MWQIGRSANPKAPYFKYLVFQSKLLKMDMYILKYPVGSKIDWHRDVAPAGYIHHRLNIILKKAKEGGKFLMKCPMKVTKYGREVMLPEHVVSIEKGRWIVTSDKRFNLFRPSITEHAVEEIKSGTRYVFSIGWLRREK